MEFDLYSAAHKLELEIEPGYRFYVPWIHREFWQEQDLNQEPNQENEARTKQGEIRLNNGERPLEQRGNREKKHNRSREEAVKKSKNLTRRSEKRS